MAVFPTYKDITVSVRWQDSAPNYLTQMDTIVMDPSAMTVQSTSNPYPQPSGGYTFTFAFKDARQLVSPYLKLTYVQIGVTKTATPSPAAPFPLPNKTSTVTYYGLPGGIEHPVHVHELQHVLPRRRIGANVPPADQRLQEVRHAPRRIVRSPR